MVLSDLGRRINSAFQDLSKVPTVDAASIDQLLKSVCNALIEADVNVKLVANLRSQVKAQVTALLNDKANANWTDAQRRQRVQKAVFDHLVALVDPQHGQTKTEDDSGAVVAAGNAGPGDIFKPKKGKPNVIMFVGLQGSGKTTSCTKLALYYQKRGFKTGLVCADTFRAGAFDQLKQNASKINVPFYGSYTETDPVAISAAGVASFKQNRFEVIIVDTSGRHKQEQELFDEMREIDAAVTPDLTIMVLDANIGQAAEAQSRAFKEAAGYGAIIVTKLDGHAKGGGAISAVAATSTPIMFIGTGEHAADLEPFRAQPFISKLLGMGDISGLMDKMEEMQMNGGQERQQEMLKKIGEGGVFSIRDWREQLSNIMGMGPLSKIAGMIPGMGQMLSGAGGDDEAAGSKMKRMMFITDAMTAEELDSDGRMFTAPIRSKKPPAESKELAIAESSTAAGKSKKKKKPQPKMRMTARARRVARGSGTSVREVEEFLMQYRMVGGMVKRFGGKDGFLRQMGMGGPGAKGKMPAPGQLPPGMSREQVMQMQNALPPEIKAQLRQPGGREKLLQQIQSGNMPEGLAGMGGMGGMGGLGGLANMMGGGGGGMPNMAAMQNMMSQMGGMGGMMNMMKGMMGGGGAGGAGGA
ncbi:Signal recognition particle, SRP54 subunit, GTPase domain protein [Kalmanozyma brasiliensis GHG001]|uniref:signal-recognition-particle GTPase n=1 Tax=Kalmanozyma brasiliensis (strain GHG001) TaxID=1365824 RepID=V5E5J7_KALBG|nr:Signal recognition particle, SRP54 subunit, GTPase domain protein [Kalmanozyma brasiliensis GHG001]EST05491.1 Signal recognition particle, SRP54 subunit, GTPase domain protein [Kalmanozyma brasiliensis GHG001]